MRILCLAALALCLAACETAEDVRLAGDGPIELRIVDPDTGAGVSGVIVAIHAEDGIAIAEQTTTDGTGLVRYDGPRQRATVTVAYRLPDADSGQPWRVDTYLDFPLQSLRYPLRPSSQGDAPPSNEPAEFYAIEAVSTTGSDELMAFFPGGFARQPDNGIAREFFEIGTFANGADDLESVLVTQQVNGTVSYQFDLDYAATADSVRGMTLSRVGEALGWNERNGAQVNELTIRGLRKQVWFDVGGQFREPPMARTSGTTAFFADMPVERHAYIGDFNVADSGGFEFSRHELLEDAALEAWTITMPRQRAVGLDLDASGQLAVNLEGTTVDPRMSYLSVFLENDIGEEWNIHGPASRTTYQLPDLPAGPDSAFSEDRSMLKNQTHIVFLRGDDGLPTADRFARALATLEFPDYTESASSAFVGLGQASQSAASQKLTMRPSAARRFMQLR